MSGIEVLREDFDRISGAEEGFVEGLHAVLRSAFDIFTEHADPLFPVLYRPCDEMVKYGGDDPDTALAELERIGDRFWRSPASQNTAGSGLGLSIARELASLSRAASGCMARVRTTFAACPVRC